MNTVNLYRTQQLAIASAIESGDYEKASDLLRRDLRTFAALKQSCTTGHNRTLTAPRKCGIIKTIKRYIRRWKQKQEGKKMKYYEFGFYAESGEFFEIRENGFDSGKKYYVSANSAEEAYLEFVCVLDEEYCGEEMTVREIPTGHDMTDYVKL